MVFFVGAGSGDPGLITVRGAALLQEADCVIYAGSLVNPALLAYCRDDCRILNSAEMTLEEVIEAVKETEKEGGMTVRLHTGDPCLYGAIKEQMDELDALGIEYGYVPGVSSFCGAASALKCEYTLPSVSQTVIITRMEGRTPVPEGEKIRSLAQHGCTMVIFLSSGMLEKLAEELTKGAYTPESKAALVYKATWPEGKVIHTDLGHLAEDAEKNGINRTALVIVGDILNGIYERSRLYDPSFTTGYREATE